ncbi:MAG: helix-turn-helix domain-containing protein [Oscillospiraceae bacterium]|jgi:transcriptional regulator with XRE-family HTH domain|nr:helix-turn-helix domain-containing protein [Oscillospiraceae bacterium]
MLRIREARKAAQLSQQEVSDRLGVTQPTFSGWESGKSPIDSNNLTKLSELLSASPNFLLGMDSEINEPILVPPELKGAYIAFNNGDKEPITQEEVDMLTQALLKARRQRSELGIKQ